MSGSVARLAGALAAGALIGGSVCLIWVGRTPSGAGRGIGAAVGDVDDAAPEQIRLCSAYLRVPVGPAHVVRLSVSVGPDGGAGEIELDPNELVFDGFGRVIERTQMLVVSREVELRSAAPDAGQAERGRAYDVLAGGLPMDPPLRLVLGSGVCGPYRLLVLGGDLERAVRVLPLELLEADGGERH